MRLRHGSWSPDAPGWGLLDVRSGKSIDPALLVSDEKIEMTDWELLDFAVQIVRQHLEVSGRKLMSWTSHPGVNPSIWFKGDNGPEWVVVCAARYPQLRANSPENWPDISRRCAHLSNVGHFASVSIANAKDEFNVSGGVPPMPSLARVSHACAI